MKIEKDYCSYLWLFVPTKIINISFQMTTHNNFLNIGWEKKIGKMFHCAYHLSHKKCFVECFIYCLEKKIEKSKKAHQAKIVVSGFECHMC